MWGCAMSEILAHTLQTSTQISIIILLALHNMTWDLPQACSGMSWWTFCMLLL